MFFQIILSCLLLFNLILATVSPTLSNCPIGYQCDSVVPIKCPIGFYSLNNKCEECDAGNYCDGESAEACNNGYYSLPGQSVCTPCPAGYYLAAGSHTVNNIQPCSTGKYSMKGQTSCNSCPEGKECLNGILSNCPNGYYSDAGQTECYKCPPGYSCSNGKKEICELGYYSPGGTTQCFSCPKSHYCIKNIVIPCPEGTYAAEGAISCTKCPAGQQCNNDGDISNCPAGTYSTEGDSNCYPCPKGYDCSTKEIGNQCALGQYTNDQGVCTACTAGNYCEQPNSIDKEQVCEDGYYNDQTGQSVCKPCTAGHECSNKETPQSCVEGTYSYGGDYMCQKCYPGYSCGGEKPTENQCNNYCNYQTIIGETLCPIGTYYDDGTNNYVGISVEQKCKVCKAGYFCSTSGTTSTTMLTHQCPIGHYCPEGTGDMNSFPCPAGTYNDEQGATNIAYCKTCPEGHHCGEGSTNANTQCQAGYYCLEGSISEEQIPCPPGTYSNTPGLTSPSQCQICTAGHYCPQGSTAQKECPAGTYNPYAGGATELESCIQCPPSYSCPNKGQTTYTERCSAGHYCPLGTINSVDYPCPAGTYTNSTVLSHWMDCDLCPISHSCPEGCTGFVGSNPIQTCSAGHYCPIATRDPKEYPCPPGTYTTRTDLYDISQCTICDAGKYCFGGGSQVSGDCAEGHYCPAGTVSPTDYPCIEGTYYNGTNATKPEDCKPCPAGYYCTSGSPKPIECPAGTYRDDSKSAQGKGPYVNSSLSYCVYCPAGSYCVGGLDHSQPCPIGTYSIIGRSNCTVCEKGYRCNEEGISDDKLWIEKECPAGYLCPAGVHEVNDTIKCSTGHYCLKGAFDEIPCPSGTYRTTIGGAKREDCAITAAGYYTSSGSSTPSTGDCDEGYYCPAGSSSPQQMSCPLGTYNSKKNGKNIDDCLGCPSGKYCPLATNIPMSCPQGMYCPNNSSIPLPCLPGSYGNRTDVKSAEECTACDPGWYCDGYGLLKPFDKCSPGYLCFGGSPTPDPVNQTYGTKCPPGGYCPLGSYESKPCREGTYNNLYGAEKSEDCFACPPGKYCAGSGSPEPTGDCFGGFFCNGSAGSPYQWSSPPGYYSENGSIGASPCPTGEYNDLFNQSSCKICPEGKCCGKFAMSTPDECPSGYYCKLGCVQPSRCPRGTFSNTTSSGDEGSCKDCPAGMYCTGSVAGQADTGAPSGECYAGYYCSGKAGYANPTDGITGDICPAGYYCPQKTGSPIPCPIGTYSPSVGLTNVDSCITCTPGKYCNETNLIEPVGLCAAGYFCASGSPSETPVSNTTYGPCPIGYSCPVGTSQPVKCRPGYYSPVTGLKTCYICPAGKYCSGHNTSIAEDCPTGSYCPEGTGADPKSCPYGTYNPNLGISSITQCIPCNEGFYCSHSGLSNYEGVCAAGYYCIEGSIDKYGTVGNETHQCPEGFYCPEGSEKPKSCPIGTYSSVTGLTDEKNCVLCDLGKYCDKVNLTQPTGNCDAGYICKRKSVTPQPTSIVIVDGIETGGIKCDKGYYCPSGSSEEIPCEAGNYNDEDGQGQCKICPEGYYCERNSDNKTGICPKGYYCLTGTRSSTQYPCPAGTYNDQTGAKDSSYCKLCPAGLYCDGTTPNTTNGNCSEGYYCPEGSITSKPLEHKCSKGDYCKEGSASKSICPSGKYCSYNNDPANCSGGYYCTGGSYTPYPNGEINSEGNVMGNICPQGHYCESGSSSPVECPIGTFYMGVGNSDPNCIICPAGYICDKLGLITPTTLCPAGYFCKDGTKSVSDAIDCDKGHYCPIGSIEARECEPGYYQDEKSQSTCKICSKGNYCDEFGMENQKKCLTGHYCKDNTKLPKRYSCPEGKYNPNEGGASEDDCLLCELGHYCPIIGMDDLTDYECTEGYYCKLGVKIPNPTDIITDFTDDTVIGGSECPAGYYCPKKSSTPKPCPIGTYNQVTKLYDINQCRLCPPGYTCRNEHNTDPHVEQCPENYYCLKGTTDNGIECPAGFYCPKGSKQPLPCLPGTYSNKSQSSCSACVEGYYCPMQTEFSTMIECSPGFYCPKGTAYEQQHPCLQGTYNDKTKSISPNDCEACPAGYYCPYKGMADYHNYECDEGYYCISNSKSRAPTIIDPTDFLKSDTLFTTGGGVCPPGYYCPKKSAYPLPCKIGTFSSAKENKKDSDCIPCWSGYYCDKLNQTESIKLCPAGKYCLDGTTSPNDAQPCPVGFYCPSGNTKPYPCKSGTYNKNENATVCEICPEGYYCEYQTDNYINYECPKGFYCPKGTRYPEEFPCPIGTYSITTMLKSQSECLPCTEGYYCDIKGMNQPPNIDRQCHSGYYCKEGMISPTPNIPGKGELCPSGTYCPSNTSTPLECPEGTFAMSKGNPSIEYCLPCPPGYYCPDKGQSDYTLLCEEGYYCIAATITPTLECEKGHYCPKGSKAQLVCEYGTYQDEVKQKDCKICEEKHYCSVGVTVIDDTTLCKPGYYCPKGTRYSSEYPCPEGTYNKDIGSSSNSSCLPCPPGYYCPIKALDSHPLDKGYKCSEGYYCLGKVTLKKPQDNLPYTTIDDIIGITEGGDLCFAGHYCPLNTSIPQKCPEGKYSGSKGNKNEDDCLLCEPGYICSEEGLSQPNKPCPEGYYCPGGNSDITSTDTVIRPIICPKGSKCPSGSSINIVCTDGYYQDLEGQSDCKKCPAGYYCNYNSTKKEICPSGFYCKENTGNNGEVYPCPDSTYSNKTGLKTEDECTKCGEGEYCFGNGIEKPTGKCESGFICNDSAIIPKPFDGKTGWICPAGSYCNESSIHPILCPAGTYSPSRGNINEDDDCLPCPEGYNCTLEGLTEPKLPCSDGYYCPGNMKSPKLCPVGHYCVDDSRVPILCPAGSYQDEEGKSTCKSCKKGNYCPLGSITEQKCEKGFYCLDEAVTYTQTPCPYKKYSDVAGLDDIKKCKACDSGKYCSKVGLTSPDGECINGHLCLSDAFVENPIGSMIGLSTGNGVCPPGYYCLNGTIAASDCPIGTFSSSSYNHNEDDCHECIAGYICNVKHLSSYTTDCPEGYYCSGGNSGLDYSNTTKHPTDCPNGYYCPTQSVTPQLCSAGYYTSGTKSIKCDTPCPEGYYCDASNVNQLKTECPKGYYCQKGTKRSTQYPCPAGTYNDQTGAKDSSYCKNCDPGKYCNKPGLESPSGDCDAGYYCVSKVIVQTPYDDDNNGLTVLTEGGSICPAGYYCPSGTDKPKPCEKGTFSMSLGIKDSTECLSCPAGFVCSDLAITNPRQEKYKCPEGYYCRDGIKDISEATICSVNHMCPKGSAYEQLCEAGTYQPEKGKGSCLPCPEGFYCEYNSPKQSCPKGFYCPKGTKYSTEHPCPLGMFNDKTDSKSLNDCIECSYGYYCALLGSEKPTDKCDPGFECYENSSIPTPTDGIVGNYCPAGYYCPNGEKISCPIGTFSSNTRNSKLENCLECPPGYICNETATITPKYKCEAGKYCKGGSVIVDCEAGNYCPEGSISPLPCPLGTFQKDVGKSECEKCPAGKYCDGGTITPEICPEGYYCLEGTGLSTTYPCLAGKYSNTKGLDSSSRCLDCPKGKYCESKGLKEPTGDCDAGYYCKLGSSTPTPTDGSSGNKCPKGKYCIKGTLEPELCPIGTFSKAESNMKKEDCHNCTAGYLCNTLGLEQPVDLCPSKYYCPGNNVKLPCSKGHYCYNGNKVPTPCVAGTYQDNEGESSCKDCPEGSYCPIGTITPYPCPPGYFCPSKTESNVTHPCPAGTYNPDEKVTTSDGCKPCKSGSYCATQGLSTVTGLCAPGYYCLEGSKIPNPNVGANGGICDAGYICKEGSILPNPGEDPSTLIYGYKCPINRYCPKGSHTPLECPPGTYNPYEGKAECIKCPAGKSCLGGDSLFLDCPARHYCPEGSISGYLCPNGTYSYDTKLTSPSQCKSCPTGSYCTNGDITGKCSAGYFCKSGSYLPQPEFVNNGNNTAYPCPAGHYCPEGTLEPIKCPSPKVRKETHGKNESDCTPCPGGYYCIENDTIPHPCMKGQYCPFGLDPIDCPVYTYNPYTGKEHLMSCIPCPNGRYCNATGLFNMSDPDYFCPEKTFCNIREDLPEICPSGTYRDTPAAGGLYECHNCTAGYYCPRGIADYWNYPCPEKMACPEGSAQPQICPAGYFCNGTTPLSGNMSDYLCPAGYYCPSNTSVPIKCRRGYYCPLGSPQPYLCPNGYHAPEYVTDDDILGTLEESCMICPPGTYNDEVMNNNCTLCDPGYVCLGGTTKKNPTDKIKDKGYVCPKGYYCPAGTSDPKPCPAGMYNNIFGGKDFSVCIPCQADYYNSVAGQSECIVCPSSATSKENSTDCDCIGSHRVFQHSDGYCLCEPGYEYWIDFTATQGDGSLDCQPIVYKRCESGEVRNHLGNCINEVDLCRLECPQTDGKFEQRTGMCECNDLPAVDQICNAECRSRLMTTTINQNTGLVEIRDYNGTVLDTVNLNNTVSLTGTYKCNISSDRDTGRGCVIQNLIVTDYGFEGNFDLSETIKNYSIPVQRRRSRYLQSVTPLKTILQPALCIMLGDGVIWDLSGGNNNYPVYMKDSLLNTNPNFDAGKFRELESLLKSKQNISSFIYTFEEEGIYVFALSSDTYLTTVITVQPDGALCPTSTIAPKTTQQLIGLAVKPNSDILLVPNWILIVTIMAGVFVTIFVILLGFYHFKKKEWSKSSNIIARYKEKGRKLNIEKQKNGKAIVKGEISGVIVNNPKNVNVGFDVDRMELGDKDTKSIADKLQEHHRKIFYALNEQHQTTKEIYGTIKDEFEYLKMMLDTLKNKKAEEDEEQDLSENKSQKDKEIELLQKLKAETENRDIAEDRLEKLQNDFLDQLTKMQELIEPHNITSHTIAEDLIKQGQEQLNDENNTDKKVKLESEAVKNIRQEIGNTKDKIERMIAIITAQKDRSENGNQVIDDILTQDFSSKFVELVQELRNAGDKGEDLSEELLLELRNFSEQINSYDLEIGEIEDSANRAIPEVIKNNNPTQLKQLEFGLESQINETLIPLHETIENLEKKILPEMLSKVEKNRVKQSETTKELTSQIVDEYQEVYKREDEREKQKEEMNDSLQNINENQNIKVLKTRKRTNLFRALLNLTHNNNDNNNNKIKSNNNNNNNPDEIVEQNDELDPLKQLHEQENKELDQNIKEEEEAQIQELNNHLDDAQNKVLTDAEEVINKRKEELEIKLKDNKDLSEEEKKKLYEELENDKERLRSVLEFEKMKQDEDLKNRLLEKQLKRKRRQMLKQQEEEKQMALLKRQKEEMDAMKAKEEAEKRKIELEEKLEAEKEIREAASNIVKVQNISLQSSVEEYNKTLNEKISKAKEEMAKKLEDLEKRLLEEQQRKEEDIRNEINERKQKQLDELEKKHEEQVKLIMEGNSENKEQEIERLNNELNDDKNDVIYALNEQVENDVQHMKNEIVLQQIQEEEKVEDNFDDIIKQIHDSHEKEYERVQCAIDLEKSRQEQLLKEKLEKRKKLNLKRLEKKNEEAKRLKQKEHDEQLQNLKSRLENEDGDWWWEETLNREIKDGVNELSLEEKELIEQKRKEKEIELQKKQEIEEQHEAEELEEEIKTEEEKAKEEEDKKAEEAINKKKLEFEAKLKMMQDEGATQEIIEALKKQHDEQLETYTRTLEDEKERQKSKLAEAMKAKKAKRTLMLKKKREAHMLKEREDMERELEELSRPKKLEKQKAAILELVEQGKIPQDRIAEAVTAILQQQHEEELQKVLTRQYRERATILKTALESFFDEKSTKRLELITQMKKDGLSSSEQEKRLDDFDNEYEDKQKTIENESIYELRLKHEQEIATLHKRQIEERTELYKDLVPPESFESIMKENEKAFEDYQKQLEIEKEKRIKEIKDQNKKKQEELQKQHDKEIEEYERKRQEEVENERKEAEEAKRKILEEQKAEREKLRKQKLEELGMIDDDAKNLIIKQFEENRARCDEFLFRQRDLQLEKIQELKDKRRKMRELRQRKLLQKKLNNEMKKEREQIEMINSKAKAEKDMQNNLQEEMKAKKVLNVFRSKIQSRKLSKENNEENHQFRPKTRSKEAERVLSLTLLDTLPKKEKVIPNAPPELLDRLSAVENLLSKFAEDINRSDYHTNNIYMTSQPYLLDPQANNIRIPEGKLEEVNINTLNEDELMRYNFGIQIVSHLGFDLSKVNIKIASSLERNVFSHNAFITSFCYKYENGISTIYIRKERLENNVGDYIMILIHILAHIKINPSDLSNDNNPLFINEYFHYLQICTKLYCQDYQELKRNKEIKSSKITDYVDISNNNNNNNNSSSNVNDSSDIINPLRNRRDISEYLERGNNNNNNKSENNETNDNDDDEVVVAEKAVKDTINNYINKVKETIEKIKSEIQNNENINANLTKENDELKQKKEKNMIDLNELKTKLQSNPSDVEVKNSYELIEKQISDISDLIILNISEIESRNENILVEKKKIVDLEDLLQKYNTSK